MVMTLFLGAAPLFAGLASRDSWVPVAGHTLGSAGGQAFSTTLYLTNSTPSASSVTLSFYPSAQPHVTPRDMTLQIAPNATVTVDIGLQLTGEGGGTGALHIASSGALLADARVLSRAPNAPPRSEVGTVLSAIPSELAIGTGDSTLLHVPSGGRYRIYAVETQGFPLLFSVMTMPGSAERRLYLSAHEQRSWDLDELFRGAAVSSLRLTGINGSGKIVAVGTSSLELSHDFSAWEMSLPVERRPRMAWPETIAYLAVALALATSAAYRSRTRRAVHAEVDAPTAESEQPTAPHR
ncbi:MAG: hypothetical protein NVSMB68_08850 [Thermoanaerobaculia bacterium]